MYFKAKVPVIVAIPKDPGVCPPHVTHPPPRERRAAYSCAWESFGDLTPQPNPEILRAKRGGSGYNTKSLVGPGRGFNPQPHESQSDTLPPDVQAANGNR